jgi:hypothetical protein
MENALHATNHPTTKARRPKEIPNDMEITNPKPNILLDYNFLSLFGHKVSHPGLTRGIGRSRSLDSKGVLGNDIITENNIGLQI